MPIPELTKITTEVRFSPFLSFPFLEGVLALCADPN